jgi:hypothetical protein
VSHLAAAGVACRAARCPTSLAVSRGRDTGEMGTKLYWEETVTEGDSWEAGRTWEEPPEIDLKGTGVRVWTALIWLRLRNSGGLL